MSKIKALNIELIYGNLVTNKIMIVLNLASLIIKLFFLTN
jgi:hypothetical protein